MHKGQGAMLNGSLSPWHAMARHGTAHPWIVYRGNSPWMSGVAVSR